METMKYEIEKFDWSSNFSLWKRKIKNILIQQEVDVTLEGDFVIDVKEEVNKIKMKKACSCIVLYLVDNVLCGKFRTFQLQNKFGQGWESYMIIGPYQTKFNWKKDYLVLWWTKQRSSISILISLKASMLNLQTFTKIYMRKIKKSFFWMHYLNLKWVENYNQGKISFFILSFHL